MKFDITNCRYCDGSKPIWISYLAKPTNGDGTVFFSQEQGGEIFPHEEDGSLSQVIRQGRPKGCSSLIHCLEFIPITRQWQQQSDVPLEAVRLRNEKRQDSRGCVIESVDSGGVNVRNMLGDLYVICWGAIANQEWLSGRDWTWRKCTTESPA